MTRELSRLATTTEASDGGARSPVEQNVRGRWGIGSPVEPQGGKIALGVELEAETLKRTRISLLAVR